MKPPQTRFEIDLGAIASNVRTIRSSTGPGVWLCAALKADAYGFGLVPVARAVTKAGADALGVGSLEDGIRLRAVGIKQPILVYAGDLLTASAVQDLERHDLIATVHDAASLRASMRFARRRLKVMIEVDVGLARLGLTRRPRTPWPCPCDRCATPVFCRSQTAIFATRPCPWDRRARSRTERLCR